MFGPDRDTYARLCSAEYRIRDLTRALIAIQAERAVLDWLDNLFWADACRVAEIL